MKFGRHFVLIGLLSLGSFPGAQAHPLDSPETVYIDGVPCNGACQSYMAWSRKTLEQSTPAPRASAPAPRVSAPAASREVGRGRVTSVASPKRATHLSAAKESVPVPRKAPRDLTAGLEYLTPLAEKHSPPAATATQETKTATAESKTVAPQPQAALPPDASDKAIEAQIAAATALADHVTAASTLAADENKEVADNAGATGSIGAQDNKDDNKDNAENSPEAAAVLPPRAPDLVVLVLARADITSVADLANKDIAIEDKQAQFREQIRTGMVAAGASMVELRDGSASAINRLVSGEQSAAVLTLASPEAADGFPDIKGFRTFRIPLSPG